MPRIVDHSARRQQIARAAMDLIADKGTKGLSIRAVASVLGGSITLVTHYYSSRAALLLDLVTQLSASWRVELDELLSDDPAAEEAVSRLLKWLLPMDEESQREERARFQILATRDEPACLAVLFLFDEDIRNVLREHLRNLVDPEEVEDTLDMLRATTDGISLGYHTAPAAWTPERQLRTLEGVLNRVLVDTKSRK